MGTQKGTAESPWWVNIDAVVAVATLLLLPPSLGAFLCAAPGVVDQELSLHKLLAGLFNASLIPLVVTVHPDDHFYFGRWVFRALPT